MPLHHPATSSDSRNLFKSKSTGTTFHTRQSRPALLLSIEPTLPSNQQLRPRPFMRGHGSDSQGIYLTYMDGSVLMDSEIGAKLVFLPRIEIGIRLASPTACQSGITGQARDLCLFYVMSPCPPSIPSLASLLMASFCPP